MESNLVVRCFSFQSHFEIGADFCQVFKRVIVLHHAESQMGILDIKNKSPPANLILCPLNSTLVEIEKLDWKKRLKNQYRLIPDRAFKSISSDHSWLLIFDWIFYQPSDCVDVWLNQNIIQFPIMVETCQLVPILTIANTLFTIIFHWIDILR